MSRSRVEEYPRSKSVPFRIHRPRLARGEIDSEEFDDIRSRLEYDRG
ncbi:MAG: hypothetical protein IH957_11180 [Chloroflexi bacterium]|nr:hypothetical protein [Chloroflexota bacterium]